MTSPDPEKKRRRLEALGKLSPAIAHDINNLLSGILGYSQMALGDPGGGGMKLCLEEIGKSGRRIASLVRILQLSSPRNAGLPESFDLNGLIREFEKYLLLLLEPQTRFSFTPGAGPLHARADTFLLRQALFGLAADTAGLRPEGGSLSLETRNAAGGEVLLLAAVSGTPAPDPDALWGSDLWEIVEKCGGRTSSALVEPHRIVVHIYLPAAAG